MIALYNDSSLPLIACLDFLHGTPYLLERHLTATKFRLAI